MQKTRSSQRCRGRGAVFAVSSGIVFCLAGLTERPSAAFFTPPPAAPPTASRDSVADLRIGESAPSDLPPSLPLDDSDTPDASEEVREKDPFYEGPRFLKFIIGNQDYYRMGWDAGLKAIEKETNTRMRLPQAGANVLFRKSARRAVIVSGETDHVLAAFEKIVDKLQDDESVSFLIPDEAAGAFIGVGGETIKQFRESSNANVEIKNIRFERENIVSVKGDISAKVKTAKWILDGQDESMRSHLNTQYKSAYNPSLRTEVMVFLPESKTAMFIGKKGEYKERLAKDFNVGLEVDRTVKGPNGESVVKISGAVGNVHLAHNYILDKFISPKKK